MLFSTWAKIFLIPTINTKVQISPHPYQYFLFSVFHFNESFILMDLKWYCTVVFIWIFLMTNGVKTLQYLLLFLYILWRNVYSSPLSFLNKAFLRLCCWVKGTFYAFWIKISYQIHIIYKYFPHFILSLLFNRF
jgi:hypothetical protein